MRARAKGTISVRKTPEDRRSSRRFRTGGPALACALEFFACSSKRAPSGVRDASAQASDAAPPSPAIPASAPKPGMAWIPAGSFRAGTPPERIPRIAEEELPGSPVEMNGFYIDLLPWPNEPNAIPLSNISRDEAEELCAGKGKRLCTELEWERACKGPNDTTYEYGNTYRKDACGTGLDAELASRRPSGERALCKSGFGVLEMHGGVWEWTSSPWGRGGRDATLGVLRGGNALAGELVGRCANAIARAPTKKSRTMGFRCCAGPRNAVEVSLERRGEPGLSAATSARAAPLFEALAEAAGSPGASVEPRSVSAWTWTPVANDALVIAIGCVRSAELPKLPRACALVIARPADNAGDARDAGASRPLASVATGKEVSEIVRNGDARKLRMRALDVQGAYLRDVTYAFGRVEIGEAKRP